MTRPDFVCAGAMRCGTTTLWEEFRQHPEIFLPDKKELHFFDCDTDYEKGIEFYTQYFLGAPSSRICGEITPSYMLYPEWGRRLHAHFPQVKLIVILRDPVKRAWSHYKFSVLWGPEYSGFEKAISLEKERITRGRKELIYFSYITRGYYIDQLEHLTRLFGRERLLVVFMEDLISNREAMFSRIRDYLELSSNFSPTPVNPQNEIRCFPRSLHVHHATKKVLSKVRPSSINRKIVRKITKNVKELNMENKSPELPEYIQNNLREIYAPYDARLSEFVKRPLPWQDK